MSISRRHLLNSSAGLGGLALATAPALAAASPAAISAADFGVLPGGSRDVSRKLQAAVDAAIARNSSLVIPPGTYIAGGVTVGKPIQLSGSPGRTILLSPNGGAVLRLQGASRVSLTGLGFDGRGRMPGADWRGALVEAEECEDLRIEACGFTGSAGSGLSLRDCSGWIAANRVGLAEKTGIFALDSRGLEIAGNHVHDIGNNGIQVWRSDQAEDGSIVAGNRVERIAARDGGSGQNGNGINVWKAGNVLIAGNRVSDCAFSAVRDNSGSACQIVDNSISRTGEVAIYVEFAFEGAVVSGNLIERVSFGISITNLDVGGRLAVCANNIVRGASGGGSLPDKAGVGIYAEADTVVSGNVVEDARDTGIALGWGRYCRNLTAIGNLVKDCGTGITASLSAGAQTVFIANNRIAGSKAAAIRGMDHREAVTADLAAAGAEVPDRIVLSGNLVS